MQKGETKLRPLEMGRDAGDANAKRARMQGAMASQGANGDKRERGSVCDVK